MHLRHNVVVASVSAVIILSILFFECTLGIDLNWDLLNYHYYNGYSALHQRLDHDINAANIQTYINPTLNIPAYLAITYLPPTWVRPALTILDGLAAPLLFMVAFGSTSAKSSTKLRLIFATLATCLGIVGPIYVQITGTSCVDILAALPVLGALAVVLRVGTEREPSRAEIFVGYGTAALLMGVAVGLKITSAVFLPGFALVVLILAARRLRWDIARLVFAASGASIGGALGLLLGMGFWAWNMYERFGNPLFPYYNNVFKSAFAAGGNFVDTKFIPNSFVDLILSPLNIALGNGKIDPLNSVSDARYMVAFVLIVYLLLFTIYVKIRQRPSSTLTEARQIADNDSIIALSVFISCGFFFWAAQFGIRRYLVTVELLSPLLALLIISKLTCGYFRLTAITTTMIGLLCSQTIAFHLAGKPIENYFARKDEFREYDGSHTTFIMTNGWSPLSYIIPLFTPDNRFIHLVGDFAMDPETPFGRLAEQKIATAQGPIKMITNISGIGRDLLLKYGLRPTGACVIHETIVDKVHICDLEKTERSNQTAAVELKLDERMDFRFNANGWIYEVNNDCWAQNENWGVWALPKGAPWCSLLLFNWEGPTDPPMRINAIVNAYLPPILKGAKEIKVTLNRRLLGVWTLADEQPRTLTLDIPAGALIQGANWLRFEDDRTVSPDEAGTGPGDHRQISFGLHRLWISNGNM